MSESKANWGGARPGSGPKSEYAALGKTKAVKIPAAVEDRIKALLKHMAGGGDFIEVRPGGELHDHQAGATNAAVAALLTAALAIDKANKGRMHKDSREGIKHALAMLGEEGGA